MDFTIHKFTNQKLQVKRKNIFSNLFKQNNNNITTNSNN
jgi:hypothetical protein